MNLINIMYNSYFIIILISLIITTIIYFIIKNNKNKNDNDNIERNIPLTLFLTFFISILLLMGCNCVVNYMNKNNYFQKGGLLNTSDKLTIIDDDIDVGLYDE